MAYMIRAAVPADAKAIAQVQVAGWHSTYTGLMPDSILADQTVEYRLPMWDYLLTRPEIFRVYVAETSAGEIVGFASGGRPQDAVDDQYQGFDCELYALYIMKAHQGHGLGRRLLSRMTTHFAEDGKSAMLLWVLDNNHGARRFYERIGGALLDFEKTLTTDEGPLREVAYGWRDLDQLDFGQNDQRASNE